MPLYTYKCPNGHETEELRKIDERDLPAVCECGCMATFRMSQIGDFKFGVGVKGHYSRSATEYVRSRPRERQ